MAAPKAVLYIRNKKPNRVNITVGDVRYGLDRRGARGDTLAIPADAKSDPNFSRNFKVGLIEEITKEEYYKLGERLEDEPQRRLKKPPLVRFDIGPDTIINDFPKEWMKPNLEFATLEDDEAARVVKLMEALDISEEDAKTMLAAAKENADA